MTAGAGRRVAVYDRYWTTAGGGEKYAGGVAEVLSRHHDVTLVAHEDIDTAWLGERLGLDLSRTSVSSWSTSANRSSGSPPATTCSSTTSYRSHGRNGARHGIYVVHFPDRPGGELLPWQRALAGRLHRWSGRRRRSGRLRVRASTSPMPSGGRRSTGPTATVCWPSTCPPVGPACSASGSAASCPAASIDRSPSRSTATWWCRTCCCRRARSARCSSRTCCRCRCGAGPAAPPSWCTATPARRTTWTATAIAVAWGSLWWPWASGTDAPGGPAPGRRSLGAEPAGGRRGSTATTGSSPTRRSPPGWIDRWWQRPSEVLEPPVGLRQPGAKDPVILSVGRFFAPGRGSRQEAARDGRGLRPAWARRPRAGSSTWRAAAAPRTGPTSTTCGRAADGLPVVLHVDARGAELDALYRRAAVYWHATGLGEDLDADPVRAEHFGITTVEAMSAGAVPVVIGRRWPARDRARRRRRAALR